MPQEKTVTPLGELFWVFTTEKGRKVKKDQNTEVDQFQASLRMLKTSPELKAFQDKVEAFWQANKPKGKRFKSNGIKPEKVYKLDKKGNKVLDKDDMPVLEETDYMMISAWSYTEWPAKNGKPPQEKKIPTFNAKGNQVSEDGYVPFKGKRVKIGNESVGWLSITMAIYITPDEKNAGVTLYLNAVQLKTLKPFEGVMVLATPEYEEGDYVGEDEATGFESHANEPDDIPEDIPL